MHRLRFFVGLMLVIMLFANFGLVNHKTLQVKVVRSISYDSITKQNQINYTSAIKKEDSPEKETTDSAEKTTKIIDFVWIGLKFILAGLLKIIAAF